MDVDANDTASAAEVQNCLCVPVYVSWHILSQATSSVLSAYTPHVSLHQNSGSQVRMTHSLMHYRR